MGRPRRYRLSSEQQTQVRSQIRADMERRGLDETQYAAFLGCQPETVRLNLGDPRYKTRRPISGEFIERVQRRAGLRLAAPAEAPPAPARAAPRAPNPAAAEALALIFLARAGLATADQLRRLLDET